MGTRGENGREVGEKEFWRFWRTTEGGRVDKEIAREKRGEGNELETETRDVTESSM